jgi:hypothetical protein
VSTPPGRPPPQVTWKTIAKVADQAHASRIEGLSDKELEEELRGAGIDPGEADAIFERASKEAARREAADAVREAARRRRTWSILVAATLAVLLLLMAWRGREVVAFLRGEPDTIEPDRWGPRKEPTPVERAAQLREQALAACAQSAWEACRQKLDEARGLDPAGEADPRVKKARADVENAMPPDGAVPDKPENR